MRTAHAVTVEALVRREAAISALEARVVEKNEALNRESDAVREEARRLQKKAAEIESKNANATKTNEIITATAKAAKEAFEAKNYDLAIAKFGEGVAAVFEFELPPGSVTQPAAPKAASAMFRPRMVCLIIFSL